eukprot:gene26451-34440_t
MLWSAALAASLLAALFIDTADAQPGFDLTIEQPNATDILYAGDDIIVQWRLTYGSTSDHFSYSTVRLVVLLEGKTNVVLETEEVDIADYQYSYSLPASLPTAKYWFALLQADTYNVAGYAPYNKSLAIAEQGFQVIREGCQSHD